MRFLDNLTKEFWWDVAEKCSYTTFFHTPVWQEIARGSFPGYQDATIGAVLPNGVRIVLPMLRTQRYGPFQRLVSTFEHCYGSIIADGPLSTADIERVYRRVCNWRTLSLSYLTNPLASQYHRANGYEAAPDATQIVELDGDFAQIFARFTKNHRHAYRRGINAGVVVRPATSLDDYRAYFGAYRDTVSRWGKPSNYGYGWTLFEQCYQMSRQHPKLIKLWVAHINDRIVGGTLVFYWHQHSVAWHGAVYREYLNYRVMNVVDTEIIRDAIDRGFRYYDFNPSAGMEGLMDYKSRFGAVERPVTHWRYEHPLVRHGLRVYRRARYGSAKRAPGGSRYSKG